MSAACAVCGAPNASPWPGHRLPFCPACEQEWLLSEERALAAMARQRFVDRMRAARAARAEEKAKGQATRARVLGDGK